jgi:hypothetical protein
VFWIPQIICHPPAIEEGELGQMFRSLARMMGALEGSLSPKRGQEFLFTGELWNPQIISHPVLR